MEYITVHYDDVYESDLKKLTATSFNTRKVMCF